MIDLQHLPGTGTTTEEDPPHPSDSVHPHDLDHGNDSTTQDHLQGTQGIGTTTGTAKEEAPGTGTPLIKDLKPLGSKA